LAGLFAGGAEVVGEFADGAPAGSVDVSAGLALRVCTGALAAELALLEGIALDRGSGRDVGREAGDEGGFIPLEEGLAAGEVLLSESRGKSGDEELTDAGAGGLEEDLVEVSGRVGLEDRVGFLGESEVEADGVGERGVEPEAGAVADLAALVIGGVPEVKDVVPVFVADALFDAVGEVAFEGLCREKGIEGQEWGQGARHDLKRANSRLIVN
jgi:hypothetical protein